jgi:acetylornithine deacetylase
MADKPVVELLKQLMAIPSISEEEYEIGQFLSGHLKSLGYTVELIPIDKSGRRNNVYAYLGSSRRTRVCLTSHMDTVPPHIPWSVKGDIIYGRGSCDDKGPMAAQIMATEELRAEGILVDGDVSLLFVVGEEKGGPGMLAVSDMDLSWEAIIFGEPTEGKLAIGHKGHYVFEVITKGVACHSGYPERGRSANSTLISLLDELKSLDFPVSELLGPSTFNCGKISGGVAYNVLAADAYALCAIRVATGLGVIEQRVEEVVAKYPGATLKKSFAYPETLLDHEVEGWSDPWCSFAIILATCSPHMLIVEYLGLESMPVSFGTDIPRLRGNHKKYLYGPGSILHAHGADEQVAIPDILRCVEVYKQLAKMSLAIK